jgi:hypothetical protein
MLYERPMVGGETVSTVIFSYMYVGGEVGGRYSQRVVVMVRSRSYLTSLFVLRLNERAGNHGYSRARGVKKEGM